MDRWHLTHEKLRQAALQLFAEYGFDGIGTAQIADRAGVSEMTLFRHFPTKEALLLEDPFDPQIAAAVRTRPESESTVHAVTEGIRQAWNTVGASDIEALRARLRTINEASSLAGALERSSEKTTAAIAEALIRRGTDAVSARVAATSVMSGLSTALLEWARREDSDLDRAVNAALDVLGAK